MLAKCLTRSKIFIYHLQKRPAKLLEKNHTGCVIHKKLSFPLVSMNVYRISHW